MIMAPNNPLHYENLPELPTVHSLDLYEMPENFPPSRKLYNSLVQQISSNIIH